MNPRTSVAVARRRQRRAHGALASALIAAAVSAHSAPPPGHPSPADAMKLMMPAPPRPAASYVGEVLGSIDANEYTYVELSVDGRPVWIATARVAVSPGDIVRYGEGVVINDFHSKLLQRTFPSVMFVSEVAITPKGN